MCLCPHVPGPLQAFVELPRNFGKVAIRISLRPAGDASLDRPAKERDVLVTRVQCGNVSKFATAGVFEELGVLQRDLFERFEAVYGEPGTNHIDQAGPLAAPFAKRVVGVRSQPFFTTYARLEADLPLTVVEIERFGHEPCCFLALAVIGVAGQ